MQAAFLAGLLDWARRETRSESIPPLPVGKVDPSELRQVVCALVRARAEQRREARK